MRAERRGLFWCPRGYLGGRHRGRFTSLPTLRSTSPWGMVSSRGDDSTTNIVITVRALTPPASFGRPGKRG